MGLSQIEQPVNKTDPDPSGDGSIANKDRGAAVSRGQEEEAVRAVREQAAAHQTFLFRLQLKRFVFK